MNQKLGFAGVILWVLWLACSDAEPVRADGIGLVSRPDGHAPISVMGDHLHHQGEWMLSYRYMFMNMDGNLDGSSHKSDREVLADYPVAPLKMDMEMHMLGLMYGVTDDVTVMAMMPFARLRMDHRTRMGSRFRTRSTGIGDLKLMSLIRLFEREGAHGRQGLHLNAGISVPTGNYHNRDETPMGNVRLPYPMQIGSGTVDLLPGATWTGTFNDWSAGGQLSGVIRLSRNSRDYSKGQVVRAQAWGARRWFPWLSSSLRVAFERMGNYGGSDKDLNPAIVPTADPRKRGLMKLELGLGLNFIVTGGPLQGHRFAVEVARPVWQDLQGPQLESEWQLVAGWQLAFGGHH